VDFTITVIGLGFVGLTTALGFAEKNNKVYGFDIDNQKINNLKSGKLPFVEPGLDKALARHINENFIISTDVKASVEKSDFIFICVGTPSGENGEADLKYIYNAIDMFSSVLLDGKYRVIVIKSTIPPSTTSKKVIPYLNDNGLNPGDLFSIANNPEFLREGNCWDDMMNSDRIVCGVMNQQAEQMLKLLYSSFKAPFFAVSLNTGEYIKYLSNTLLSTMVSYANEMSKIADAIGGIEVKEAFEILHLDKRWNGAIMASYVYPGCGYGGYCLPKDTKALYANALSNGYESLLLKNVSSINDSMPKVMTNKIKRIAKPSDKIGILGLSFKPGSDDVRDSSSAKIINLLLDSGYCNILAFDPLANKSFEEEYNISHIIYYDDVHRLCEKTDILVLVTAWEEFAGINKKYPEIPIIDCRYFL
jgi:UDPglucose 6-dehydrogenase